MRKIFLLLGIISCFSSFIFSQNKAGQSGIKVPIFNAITNDNGTSKSKITIHQDERIPNLMNTYINRIDIAAPYSGAGFRVQVFSSNNYKTAKNDAARVERQLRAAFPQHQVYVSYFSPFWKVRIGNFRTSEDAQKLRTEIIRLFPELRKDCYTVRDNNVKIN